MFTISVYCTKMGQEQINEGKTRGGGGGAEKKNKIGKEKQQKFH